MNHRTLSTAIAAGWLAPLCALLLTSPGCVTTPTWDDAARKSLHSSVVVANEFLKFEAAHRSELPAGVSEAADEIRVAMPTLVRQARAALDAYDTTKSATDQALAQAKLAEVSRLAAVASAQLAAIPTQ